MQEAQELTVGLEIHAELKTRTKMFCDSLNDPDEHHPNVNVCPVCMGHPGTLPTINKKAVESMIRIGLALGGTINPKTKFDRKNYFYPDLPKGYQISQFDEPIVQDATLEFEVNGEMKKIRIRRVHLEEDAAASSHAITHVIKGSPAPGSPQEHFSVVDFNRAGVPLMELVTEPDVRSAEEAIAFAKELQLILRSLGVSDANMEKGQMRIEANVSVSKFEMGLEQSFGLLGRTNLPGKLVLGTRTEVKNLNSFRSVGDAIRYEFERQKTALEAGEKIKQETRGWDEVGRKTVSQRSKEEAHDYRYFPEPDLPPFETSSFDLETLKASLPELPSAKRARLAKEYGLAKQDVELLLQSPALSDYFEEAVSELTELIPDTNCTTLWNYLTSDLRGLMQQEGIGFDALKIKPEHFAHLVAIIERKELTSRQAKDVLAKIFETGLDPEDAVQELGFTEKVAGHDLDAIVAKVIEENPAAVADYKKGKSASVQFLVGKAMAATNGKANPEEILMFLEKALHDLIE